MEYDALPHSNPAAVNQALNLTLLRAATLFEGQKGRDGQGEVVASNWSYSHRGGAGRPRVMKTIVDLALQMAIENG